MEDGFARFGYDPDDPVPRGDDGERLIPERLLSRLARTPLVDETLLDRGTSNAVTHPTITPAETRILQCLAVGLGDQGTADLLGVTRNTVRTQSKSARLRLHAKNTTHACCLAIVQGLITGPPTERPSSEADRHKP